MFEERFMHEFDLKEKQEIIAGLEKRSFYITKNSSKKPILNFEVAPFFDVGFKVSFYGEKLFKMEFYEGQEIAEKRAYDCTSLNIKFFS